MLQMVTWEEPCRVNAVILECSETSVSQASLKVAAYSRTCGKLEAPGFEKKRPATIHWKSPAEQCRKGGRR